MTDIMDKIPSRMALAGGWIDQPFVSRLNPHPPGSMVVVSLMPTVRFMNRAGMATGTRKVANKIWKNGIPRGDPMLLVKELYAAENQNQTEPSGSQDMIGLIYPGISRIDYDADHEGGYFPVYIESSNDPSVARWLEQVIHMVPVGPRPEGYNPLEVKCLDPQWIARLGQTGKDCFEAIVHKDIKGLAASMNQCMKCWETLLPCTLRQATLKTDLPAVLNDFQKRYQGAMYSGCGGGYLYVVSDRPVPGAFKVQIRIAKV